MLRRAAIAASLLAWGAGAEPLRFANPDPALTRPTPEEVASPEWRARAHAVSSCEWRCDGATCCGFLTRDACGRVSGLWHAGRCLGALRGRPQE